MQTDGLMAYLLIVGACLLGLFALNAGWANYASFKSWGKSQHIVLYSTSGNVINSWDSEGQIQNESNSDGFHFMDRSTKKQIRISGTTVVTTSY